MSHIFGAIPPPPPPIPTSSHLAVEEEVSSRKSNEDMEIEDANQESLQISLLPPPPPPPSTLSMKVFQSPSIAAPLDSSPSSLCIDETPFQGSPNIYFYFSLRSLESAQNFPVPLFSQRMPLRADLPQPREQMRFPGSPPSTFRLRPNFSQMGEIPRAVSFEPLVSKDIGLYLRLIKRNFKRKMYNFLNKFRFSHLTRTKQKTCLTQIK